MVRNWMNMIKSLSKNLKNVSAIFRSEHPMALWIFLIQ